MRRLAQRHSPPWTFVLSVVCMAGAVLVGCQTEQPAAEQPQSLQTNIQLTSPAFAEGQPIPIKYTGEGEDISPPLEWTGLPEGTKELALICDDPDAPRAEPWVHWVIYKIPATVTGLPEGIEQETLPQEPAGAIQGQSSSPGQNIGYHGPMPPEGHGPHRYYFKLYAIDTELAEEAEMDKEALLEAIEGHILAEGQLMGTYER